MLGSAALTGETVREVAAKAGIDTPVAEKSVLAYNELVRSGDEDPLGKPRDQLQTIERGPFLMVDVSVRSSVRFPCPVMSLGGLVVDEETGKVLRQDESVVEGLYAAGRTAAGICSKSYVSGLSLADCVFSGRRAGRAVGAEVPDARLTSNAARPRTCCWPPSATGRRSHRWSSGTTAWTSSTPTRSSCSTSAAGWRPARPCWATRSGLSSLAMQQMMGVDEPDYGHLLADMGSPPRHPSTPAATATRGSRSRSRSCSARTLPGAGCTEDDVLAATEAVAPSIELIDSRILDWRIGLADTIADNASSAGFVLGPERVEALRHRPAHHRRPAAPQRRGGRRGPLRRGARQPGDRGRLAGSQGRRVRRAARGGSRDPARLVHPRHRRPPGRRLRRRVRRPRLGHALVQSGGGRP